MQTNGPTRVSTALKGRASFSTLPDERGSLRSALRMPMLPMLPVPRTTPRVRPAPEEVLESNGGTSEDKKPRRFSVGWVARLDRALRATRESASVRATVSHALVRTNAPACLACLACPSARKHVGAQFQRRRRRRRCEENTRARARALAEKHQKTRRAQSDAYRDEEHLRREAAEGERAVRDQERNEGTPKLGS